MASNFNITLSVDLLILAIDSAFFLSTVEMVLDCSPEPFREFIADG
jgi:hypothetical protein